MKVEEIESMLKDNKFDLNDIQILLDELAYNYDMIEELDEEVAQYKEDTNEYAKMYNEFNRDLPGYAIEIRNLESAIEKLDEKQQRLGGRISKKDVEKRNDYEQQIQDLKEKYEFSKSNRIASREGYNESKVKYDELIAAQKEGIAKKQFEEYTNKLEDICKYCLSKMKEKDNKLEELRVAMVNCVDATNISGYAAEFSKELDERNKFYSNFEKVVKMIAESEEYQSTVGKNLIEELNEELSKEVEPEVKVEEATAEVEAEVKVEEATTEVEPEVKVEEATTEVEPEVKVEEVTAEVEPEAKVEEATAEVEPEVKVEEVTAEVEPEAKVEEATTEVEPEVKVEEATAEVEPEIKAEENAVEIGQPAATAMAGQNYWEMQYPKINNVEPYTKDMSAEPMTLEELANQGPIFRDEERIDSNYDSLSYQNAKNLGHTNEGNLANEKVTNEIVKVEYAPEGILNKVKYNLLKKVFKLKPEKLEEWCQSKAEEQNKKK